MTSRAAWGAVLAGAAAWLLAGCKSVDEGLLRAPSDATIDDAGLDAAPSTMDARMPEMEGGTPSVGVDAEACTAEHDSPETCNGVDDDCDQKVDEGGDQWCADNVIMHALAVCDSNGDPIFCVRMGDCESGYYSCDGDPANGCESSFCACHTCPDDAGMDDAGP